MLHASLLPLGAIALAGLWTASFDTQKSKPFIGVKANAGTVTFTNENGKPMLTLSDDFKVPDTPAPHWQLVDARGNAYLLARLLVKEGKLNKSIAVPDYVHEVAKVQIWCAFAETLLGEAAFESPVL